MSRLQTKTTDPIPLLHNHTQELWSGDPFNYFYNYTKWFQVCYQTCLVQSVAICPWKSCFYVKNYVLFLNKKRASWPYLYKPPCMKKKKKKKHDKPAYGSTEKRVTYKQIQMYGIFHFPSVKASPVQATPANTQHWPYLTAFTPALLHCRRIGTLPVHRFGATPSEYGSSQRPASTPLSPLEFTWTGGDNMSRIFKAVNHCMNLRVECENLNVSSWQYVYRIVREDHLSSKQ